ncbi:MAG: hypothetical protein II838_15065, partial [Lachnospiraceae bacterium]|nr:hypothetical protein [Lachnospiraceae bacterium]
TGMYAKVKITVKADETATAAPSSDAPATLAPATDAPVGPTVVPTSGGAVTTAPTSGGAVTAAPTSGGAVTAAPTATPAVPVVSASAISAVTTGASLIAVTFNQPVVATGDAVTFAVTKTSKGSTTPSTVVTSVEKWEGKTTALLNVGAVEGDATYSITATETEGKPLTANVVGVAAKDTTLAITSERTFISGGDISIDISLKNQFGENVATNGVGKVTCAIYNKTQAKSVVTGKIGTTTDGKIIVNNVDSLGAGIVNEVGDVLQVTLLSGSLTATKELTIVNGIIATTASVGTVSFANTTEDRLIENDSVKIPLSVVDQFGDKINYTEQEVHDGTFNGLTIIANADFDLRRAALSNGVISIPTNEVGTDAGKETSIYIQVGATGQIIPVPVKIYKKRRVAKIAGFSKNSKFAKNLTMTEDSNLQVQYSDFKFEDQYGKEITPPEGTVIKVKDTTAATCSTEQTSTAIENQGLVVLNAAAISLTGESKPTSALEATSTDEGALTMSVDPASPVVITALHGSTTTVPTEKVTFSFTDGSTTTSVDSVIKVIPGVTDITMTTDKTTYTAGETATLTIKAMNDTAVNTEYEKSQYITFSFTGFTEKYTRLVTFVKGVATTTVPMNKSGVTEIVTTAVEGQTGTASGLTVNVGAFDKYVALIDSAAVADNATANFKLTAKDKYGNTVTTKELSSELVKVSLQLKEPKTVNGEVVGYNYTDVALAGSGIDSEGTILATENAGVVTIAGSMVANTTVAGKTYVATIVADGVSYTVEFTAIAAN